MPATQLMKLNFCKNEILQISQILNFTTENPLIAPALKISSTDQGL